MISSGSYATSVKFTLAIVTPFPKLALDEKTEINNETNKVQIIKKPP